MMDIWTTALLVCLIFLFGFFTGGYACERWSGSARKADAQAAQSEHVALGKRHRTCDRSSRADDADASGRRRRGGRSVRVRFWTIQTGLQPQMGTVVALRAQLGYEEAEIAPDDGSAHVYLFCGAIWGYEPIEEVSA